MLFQQCNITYDQSNPATYDYGIKRLIISCKKNQIYPTAFVMDEFEIIDKHEYLPWQLRMPFVIRGQDCDVKLLLRTSFSLETNMYVLMDEPHYTSVGKEPQNSLHVKYNAWDGTFSIGPMSTDLSFWSDCHGRQNRTWNTAKLGKL